MPTASDFRRELRAADALLYAQRQAALRALPPAPPPSPPLPRPVTERHRTATIAAGILAGLTLIAAGEVMHLRSIPAAEVTRAPETQAASEPTAVPAANRKPAVRDAQNRGPTRTVHTVTAASSDKSKSTPSPPFAERRQQSARGVPRNAGKMDRLHLGWLRNVFRSGRSRTLRSLQRAGVKRLQRAGATESPGCSP
jgi:hypothetical protein